MNSRTCTILYYCADCGLNSSSSLNLKKFFVLIFSMGQPLNCKASDWLSSLFTKLQVRVVWEGMSIASSIPLHISPTKCMPKILLGMWCNVCHL